jgi:hypothetical protein
MVLTHAAGGPRPFTDAVNRKRRQGLRYIDLETESNRARSTAWFNNLVNARTPWKVSPPSRESFAGLCKLFDVDEALLRQWIAQEWYGSEVAKFSPRVVALARQIDELDQKDAELVAALIARLTGGTVNVLAAAA